jgi:hypothetical protein
MIIAAMVAGATPDCVTAKLRHGRHFFRKGFERNESSDVATKMMA